MAVDKRIIQLPLMNKPAYQPQLSRQTITAWIHGLLPDLSPNLRIEELGKGVVYCRIVNYYFPGSIVINRIIWHPKTEYENTLNLRIAQNAMAQLRINVPIDPIKLSKQKLNDNWTFITALYRYLTHNQEESFPVSLKEEKHNFSMYSSKVTPNHSMMNQNHSSMMTPKRPLEQVYSQPFIQNAMRLPFYAQESSMHQKSYYNASKYSVGKLYKESSTSQGGTSSPNKGKWSVNSHMFHNNLMPIIDRVKEILLKSSHDTEKIRQIKMLLNIPLNEEVVVKVQQDENNPIITIINDHSSKKINKESQESYKGSKQHNDSLIQTKEEIKLGSNQ